MSTLTRGVYAVARTKRKRFMWCAWWSGEPTAKPWRAPDAWGGGAETEDEARTMAEEAAARPLERIDDHWAGAFRRVRAGMKPFPTQTPKTVDAAPKDKPVDPYRLLGVTSDATLDDVKLAFRKKALESHPDHGGSTEAFIALKRAYDGIVKRRSRPQKRTR